MSSGVAEDYTLNQVEKLTLHLRRGYSGLLRFLDEAGSWLDSNPLVLFTALAMTYWGFLLLKCWYSALWHDELFTFYFGRMSNIWQMLRDIPQIDLNPPVLYVLEYAVLHAVGPLATGHFEDITARLPSLVAGFLASMGLAVYLRRKVSPLWIASGIVWLWQTPFWHACTEDRPYALLMAFFIWLVIAWERATQPNRTWKSIVAVLLLAFGMMGSHFMAALILPGFWAAELTRVWKRRKLDLPLTISLLLPLAIPVIYHGLIRGYGHMLFPPAFQPRLGQIKILVSDLMGNTSCLLLTTIVCLIVTRRITLAGAPEIEVQDERNPSGPHWEMRLEDVVLLLGLALEPLFSLLALRLQHAAYFVRYALPGAFPEIVFLVWLFTWRFKRERKRVALLVFLIGCTFIFPVLMKKAAYRLRLADRNTPSSQSANYHDIDGNLPFVVDSGITFVEMNDREKPGFLHRVYYLTDQKGAVKYAHATIFQHEQRVAKIFGFVAHVEKLKEFEAGHKEFLVLGTYSYPENWLLRKLEADGDHLTYLGNVNDSYNAVELYKVTLK